MFKVRIDGIPELRARLDLLEQHIRKRLLVSIMKKALMPMMASAQAKAPFGEPYVRRNKKSKASFTNIPGWLKRSFRIKKMRGGNPYEQKVQLQNTAYYAYWVEKGHRIVKNKKVVGRAAAHPYMAPAYEAGKEQVVDIVASLLRAGLARRGV